MSTATGTAPALSDRTLTRLLRVSVVVLVLGLVAFGVFYYLDQHVAGPPSLVDQQITSAEAAVRKAPNDLDARLQLAAVYQADKRNADALTQYDEILSADGTNRLALLGRGYVYLQQGSLDKARADYAAITGAVASGEFAGADPQLQEAYYYLGVIDVREKKPQEALTQLDAALKIEDTDSDALYQVGLAQLQLNQPKLAVEAFTKALTFVPTGWCDPYTQMAAAYTTLGGPQEASYATAMATFCKGHTAQAKTALQGLTDGPAGVDAMLGLALIAQTEGSTADAVGWYKKVLTVDHSNVQAMSALSELGVGPKAATSGTAATSAKSSSTSTQGHQ